MPPLVTERHHHPDGTVPSPKDAVWVFGSNLAGRHGKGAAQVAYRHFGAIYGQGKGRQGMSFAIPTKGWRLEVLPSEVVQHNIEEFIAYARENPTLTFWITRVGCGLAGFADSFIAPLFAAAPVNCSLPEEWRRYA